MYEYIKGKLESLTPTYAVVENEGIGYIINISLNTYSKLTNLDFCQLFIHQVIREDANILFGFFEKGEREIFRLLISVSGVGANTARMMLSSLSAGEIQSAIMNSDVEVLKSIKGIGAKSAQRIIVDLKDKIDKVDEISEIFVRQDNTIKDEALSALVMLGFSKKPVEKILEKLMSVNNDFTVEDLIKQGLKRL